jgi:hypothetical protein
MPNYAKVGFAYRIHGRSQRGPVIASSEALYLLTEAQSAGGAIMVGAAAGGLIGAGIAAAATALLNRPNRKMERTSPDQPYTCDFDALPAEVTSAPSWPFKKYGGSVLVVPRAAVKSIRHPMFSNELRMKAGDVSVLLMYGFFTGKRVMGLLAEMGWPIGKGKR